ncbi:cell division protein ZipA [Marinobacter bohaiensis]|uniref:cell division protein ZipA n=1 Tax=Marinobacter bohaiensis TaxID=2201898 RepID=UPI000DAD5FAE|nr:cell division protein ZipA [Marinobacter bohaiensis]
MSLREWLIAIGALIILGIVIDGVRRMRRARKEAIAISNGMGADDIDGSPIDEEFNPELPNGGSRPVTADTLEERGYVRQAHKSRFGPKRQKPTRPVVDARPESVPEVTDTVADDESFKETTADMAPSPGGYEADEVYEADAVYEEPVEHMSAVDEAPDDYAGGWDEPEDERFEEPVAESAPQAPEPEFEPEPAVQPTVEDDTASRHTAGPHAVDSDAPKAGANRPDAQEVIVINVLSRQDKAFEGPALRKLFEACGLEFGDMDIYHRHEESDTRSPVQFSVASAVEPGTFRPEDMKTMSTPGISFFMSMPGPSDSLKAFEFMLETAQCVVHNLGGEMKDERRSVMTPQTIEHCRQRIREFERKRRSKRVG